MHHLHHIPTPFGRLGILGDGLAVTRIFFADREPDGASAAPEDAVVGETPLLREAAAQLSAYLEGRLMTLDFPFSFPGGTPFQQQVWNVLLSIPYGETRSYKEVAALTGHPGAFRAVGQACNKNPLALRVPCHRVVGADHRLTGYAGGLDIKAALLEMERGRN
ncbi:methylated-DNA--[protein]-cysteine S-methyltransferase [Anaerotalea alkaliphila]|uniref:Methylated-DNA--protein-cysteine methyltransferase n=1 Tax=Anaerotalea alkaliphila TaxID=2662126 RepID=A0A7X5HXI7_9FIRM|nr:methylated-DNA--[protein]-cysteine S-methyltransferase [Anaerotalea alkaliphila]NDL68455.1 methylated-DNA--[protein]-cysteine S-methyltransferase [Anaerotalea alkaliphila]